jgi:phthalate 4,5-cis-dihydrodiol dehydrogenase
LTLRLGFLGLGRAAASLVPSVLSHPHVEIAAAADTRQEVRDRFGRDFGVPVYAQAEELCADPNVDAVYVATPHALHAPQSILAAEHGKHVLVEKPMALTLEDCDAMLRAADRNSVHLVVGHTHSFDPPVQRMREIIRSGELGRLAMVNTWMFSDFLYRPRRPEELDTGLGGGIIFNQVPHQVDVVRFLGGGLVRTVRSAAWVLDPFRPTEGSHVTFLEFEGGAAASLVYSGYDFFDTDEFHGWLGEEGQPKEPSGNGSARRRLGRLSSPEEERELKAGGGYGAAPANATEGAWRQPHFGVLVASCERGDMRVGAKGVVVYDERGVREIALPPAAARPDKSVVVDELYQAVATGQAPVHDGAWGQATLEVCLAILTSAREHREVTLSHQVAVRDEHGVGSGAASRDRNDGSGAG